MQKTTVFTLLFSVLVVALVAEVLTGNSLRSGWSSVISPDEVLPSSSGAASVVGTPAPSGTSGTAGVTVVPAVPSNQPISSVSEVVTPLVDNSGVPTFSLPGSDATVPAATAPPAPLPVSNSSSEVSSFMQDTSFAIESVTQDNLKDFGFAAMHLERSSTEGLLYQLLDLGDLVNLSKIRFHLTDGKSVYGVISEYRAADAARASEVYAALKRKASAFHPEVTVNETSQFGTASFYLNDTKRMGTAFLTVLYNNHVFGFAYPKASHAFFSKLVNFLAKRP